MKENDLKSDIELVERVVRASTMNVSDEISYWLARVEAWNRIKAIIKQSDRSDKQGLQSGHWAEIINDARWYDGTPQGLIKLREHFMKKYKLQKIDSEHLPDVRKVIGDNNGRIC